MPKTPIKLSVTILKRIKIEEIKQRPSWHFWLKNSAFWIIFGLAALIGGRAIGVMGMVFNDVDLPFLMEAHGPVIHHLATILPLFWMVFFLLFLLLANYGLHHTKKGYKFGTTKLVGINLIISLIIGGGAFLIEDGEYFEKMVHEKAPIFKKMEDKRRQVWSNPDEGRIAGTIVIIQDETILVLDDFNNTTWTVNYSEAKMRRRFDLREGIKIGIVGNIRQQEEQQISQQEGSTVTFIADKIGPWHKRPKK
jgi:hypothetical protein